MKKEPREAAGPTGGERVTCSFCGREFAVRGTLATCASCPVSSGCGKVCCPFCGYGNIRPMADSPAFWKRLFRRDR